MAATYQVTPPESFTFKQPQEWPKWIRRFERFRSAAGLAEKAEEVQVNTLIYTMGDEADDILRSFQLSEEDKKDYKIVKEKFEAHFVKRRNIIFERAKFNMRKQEGGESVDAFITDLYALAEHCGYNTLHDEMIRDRLVVGLRDAALSEKLQLDAGLTLDKAVTRVRQAEAVKKQQSVLRGEGAVKPDIPVGAIQRGRPKKGNPQIGPRQKGGVTAHKQPPTGTVCSRCGKSPAHDRQRCPARDATCHKCGKRGHYQRVCKSAKVGVVQKDETNLHDTDDAFLGTVGDESEEPWTVNALLNETLIEFHIDTGAEVTVISELTFKKLRGVVLLPSLRTLRGPSRETLPAKGQFRGRIRIGDREVEEDIYVVEGLCRSLLGLPAIESLKLLARVGDIEGERSVEQLFPQLFTGLGKIEQEYTIKLREGAQPFSLNTPRRVPIPLMQQVRNELDRMERLGVISQVEDPTEWCAGMVVVPKANGQVRICVDLTKLNENVCRERHQLPAVEQTLAQIAGAQVFTKLDANSGFWQIPLSEESAL